MLVSELTELTALLAAVHIVANTPVALPRVVIVRRIPYFVLSTFILLLYLTEFSSL